MTGANESGPGAVRVRPGWVEINGDRSEDERQELTITNTADRPIQVGSHIHLADVNPALQLDREQARGCRLDIPAGTSVRFEPGVSKRTSVVTLRGSRQVPGIQRKPATIDVPDSTQDG
jgi:urease subunit beta